MSYADYCFVKNCREIITNGISDDGFQVRPKWHDGTPAHTKKILHAVDRYQLSKDSIPVMTLRKTGFRTAIDEILWIYQQKSNELSKLHSHIWDDWNVGDGTIGKAYGYQIGKISRHHKYRQGENLDGIKFEIRGESGGDWIYLSQIDAVLWDLKNNPGSRSIMTNTYDHEDLAYMGLRPCAFMMVFNVTMNSDNQMVLNGCLVQRSQDMLTANNWNVVQYSVLLQMIAQSVGMIPGALTHVVFDMHIYDRHIPIVESMIDAYDKAKLKQYTEHGAYATAMELDQIVPYSNPTFWINPDVHNFYDFQLDDFALENYQYLPFEHKIEVAV